MQSTYSTPQPIRSFSQILPDNFLDPLINQLAESQINPEIQRMRDRELTSYGQQLGQSGGYRSGVGLNQREGILNNIERQRKEQVGGYYSTLKNQIAPYYNQLYNDYMKNPSNFVAPKMTSYNDFIQQNPNLFGAYQNQISGNPGFNMVGSNNIFRY